MKRTEHKSWENFFAKNRSDFDTKTPDNLWGKIENELPKRKKKTKPKLYQLWNIYKYAALFIFALGFGYLVMYLHFTNADSTSKVVPTEVLQLIDKTEQPEYLVELNEVENYYSNEIEVKLVELKGFGDNKEVIEELNLLQAEFDELKSEMGDHINDERIVRAMIQNYRLRLELLKEILIELNSDASNQKDRNYGNVKI